MGAGCCTCGDLRTLVHCCLVAVGPKCAPTHAVLSLL